MDGGRRWEVITAVLLLVAVVFAFAPGLEAGFVWDDVTMLEQNWAYRGLTPDHLWWMLSVVRNGHYHPLTWLSFAIDHAVWGMTPFGYHLTNIVLHAGAVVLFFFLAVRIIAMGRPDSRRDPATIMGAAFAAAVFAVHPLRVESVVWVTERRDVLAGLFYLVGVHFYLSYAATSARRMLVLAVVAFALSGLAKAWIITLPVVLLILDFYPLRRLSFGDRAAGLRGVLVEKIPFALLAVGVASVGLFAQSEGSALWRDRPFIHPFLQAGYGLCFYIAKWIAPVNLSPLYILKPDRLTDSMHIGASLMVVLVSILLLLRAKRQPALFSAWALYVVIVAPVLGFAQSGPQHAADRYSYLALWSPTMLVGAGVAAAFRRTSALVVGALVVALSVLMTLASQRYALHWKDQATLFTRAIELDPENHDAWAARAQAFEREGRLVEAEQDLGRAIELGPRRPLFYHSRAMVRLALRRPREAFADADRAVRLQPEGTDFRCARGTAAVAAGMDPNVALKDFEAGLAMTPGSPSCLFGRAVLYASSGRPEQALADLDQVLAARPDSMDALANRARINHQLGRLDVALADLNRAIRLNPRAVQRYADRATVHLARKDGSAALADFTRAIELEPGSPVRWADRGSAHQRIGNKQQAIADFSRALSINPAFLPVLVSRGRLYLELGDATRGRADLEAALARAPEGWPMRNAVESLLAGLP